MTVQATESSEIIKQKLPQFQPEIAIVLGSGLGVLAEHIDNPTVVPYEQLPGFHKPGVEGHGGKLFLGHLQGVPVMCLQGRAHFYEGVDNETIQTMVRTARALGCKTWLATNASGSLHADTPPGSLVAIKDHINLQFNNPLVGPNDDNFGPRFIGMEDAYNAQMRKELAAIARSLNIPLKEGVYLGVLGPSFETPAEINAFRILGADLVGMSTIPEVIAARHCGMKVMAIAVITNLAAGMHNVNLTHDETLKGAKLGAQSLVQLVLKFLENMAS